MKRIKVDWDEYVYQHVDGQFVLYEDAMQAIANAVFRCAEIAGSFYVGDEQSPVEIERAIKCEFPEFFGGGGHDSDCATHNAPAYPAGNCDCDAAKTSGLFKRQK